MCCSFLQCAEKQKIASTPGNSHFVVCLRVVWCVVVRGVWGVPQVSRKMARFLLVCEVQKFPPTSI